jgi:hypothetical protein
MTLVIDSLVDPVALTTFVRAVPTQDTMILNQVLPDRTVLDDRIRFDELIRTNRVAQFRSFDATVPLSKRDVTVRRESELPPISVRSEKGERERLLIERLRNSGSAELPQVEAIYNDAERGARYIQNRMELARGQVLTTGKLTISNENGLFLEADFGVPSGNFVESSVAWSDTANATIVDDYSRWTDVYVDENGFPPTGQIVSRKQLNALLRNAEIRSMAQSLGGTPNLVTRPVLDAVLSAHMIPPIWAVYETRVEVEGVSTRVMDEDKVVLVGPELGMTAWGITATALELVGSNAVDMAFSDAAGITSVLVKSGPPFRQEVWTDALAMPVLGQPRRLMVADVTVTEESSSSV